MIEVQEKFIKLLKEMFQFDQADLDFGIYRIMNAKHDEIEKFLNEYLPKEIDEGLVSLESFATSEQIKKIKDQIATAKSMDLDQAMKDSMIAKLEEQKAKLDAVTDMESAQNEIYNNLLDFFSRYYDEGDFISQRRYSKGKYAIPYEGEEVKLHWANADQYYIKTCEYFKDYSFSDAFGKKVHFKILDAETEQNNNKSKDKKFFQLTSQEKKFEVIDDEFYIYVEYKAGTQKTQKHNKAETIQKLYNAEIIDAFTKFINADLTKYQSFSGIAIKEKGQKTSLLEKQLTRYTAKNSFDYFIHKNLRGFLNQELDFFIKNELIRLDDIDENDEAKTKLILTKAKVLRAIAKKIIAFLSQLEDFQKKLFLKKKFVTETNYCITLDRIAESFYEEIAANEEQRKEWVKLFAIDELKATSGDLLTQGKTAYSEPLTVQFLKENPFLVLDTVFFNEEFKEKLVASIAGLDEKLDGLLIHSENFQALNFLRRRYEGLVDCCYIDPPYNSPSSEIIYKNNYKDSSWISLMENRLVCSKEILSAEGSHVVAIDKYEQSNLFQLINTLFPNNDNVSVCIEHNKKGTQGDHFSFSNEFAIFSIPYTLKKVNEKKIDKEKWEYSNLRNWGGESERSDAANCFFPIYCTLADKIIIGYGGVVQDDIHPKENEILKNVEYFDFDGNVNIANTEVLAIYPIDETGIERKWRYAFQTINEIIKDLRVKKERSKNYTVEMPKTTKTIKTLWADSIYNAGDHGTKILNNLGLKQKFNFPKSIHTVEDCVYPISRSNSIILDYFAGSGTTAHAVINLNMEDGGSRKYILCEMGEYFDTVTKPRVEKVIYSKEWKNGKPLNRDGISHAFKYIRLESYEDTLNNITLDSQKLDLIESARKDYFLNYMMDFESKDSDSLLNIEKLAHPFNYVMKITRKQECKEQKIDLVETFNYLIGLNVTSNGAMRTYDATFSSDASKPIVATLKNNGSTYRIKMIEGTNRAGERVLVIWRDLTGDIEKDNAVLDAFFAKKHVNPLDFEYKTIYVNGDNNLQNVKTEDENWKVVLIESEMKKRMFSEN